jgi:hypothetical protein
MADRIRYTPIDAARTTELKECGYCGAAVLNITEHTSFHIGVAHAVQQAIMADMSPFSLPVDPSQWPGSGVTDA